MSISILYHILSISFVFEKGGERGYMWKCGERDRMRAENRFWRNVVNAISTSVSEDIDMTYNELKRIITDNELYTQNEEANEMIEQKGDLFVLSLVDRGEMRNCELITDENLACAKYLSRIIGGYRRANCKGTLEVGKLYILRNWVNQNEYIIIAVDDVADYITEHGTVMKDVTSVRLSIIKDLKDAIDGDDYMLRLSYSIACRLVNYYAKSLFECSICIGAFEGLAGGNAGPIIISEYDLTVLLREQYG